MNRVLFAAFALGLTCSQVQALDLKTHKECLVEVEKVAEDFDKATAAKQPPDDVLKSLDSLSKKIIEQCSNGDYAAASATYTSLRVSAGLPKK